MYVLFIILVVFSITSVFAIPGNDHEALLIEMIKKHEDEDFQLRTSTQYKVDRPNDQYVLAYKAMKEKQLRETFAFFESECRKMQDHCLTQEEIKLAEAQNRIAIGLVERRNGWLKTGLSENAVKQKESEYQRESAINICAHHNKDCNKLSEAERQTADARRGRPESGGDTSVIVSGGGTSTGPGEEGRSVASSGVDANKELAEAALKKEIDALYRELETKYTGTVLTKEGYDAFRAAEQMNLQKTIAMYKELCRKFPNDPKVCLTEDHVKNLKEDSDGRKCYFTRRETLQNAQKAFRKSMEEHLNEWKEITPKDCKLLLQKDSKPPTEEPSGGTSVQTEQDNQEEENRRNYVASKCVWVTNIPRKIVKGPACGNTPNEMCVGHVSCPRATGEGFFTRMSTCRASFCGDAVKCTKDPLYGSRKPSSEDKFYVSPEIKMMLKTSAPASRQ